MSKPTVGVFFGSRSAEHDVSIVTAISAIIKPLKLLAEYEVLPVYIAKDGRWYAGEELADITLYSSGRIEEYIAKKKPVQVLFDNGLVLVEQGIRGKKRQVDIAFPATHGTHGEDGHLMGVFEMAGIPYVGCDVESSAIAMDKVATKMIANGVGLKTVPDVIFTREEYENDADSWLNMVEKQLGYPAFVKPPHLGSSIGVTKVVNRTELANAIEVALIYDWRVLVEMAVPNLREATLPIVGNGANIVPALLEEPSYKTDEYFDFDTKYMNQSKSGKKMGDSTNRGSQGYSHIPADFDKDTYKKAEKVALSAYKAVGCCGTARVDILIDYKTKDIYFNEINPLPGSLYAHNWRAAGVSNVQLVEKLIGYAIEKHEANKKLTTTFSTNFLKQF